VQACGSKCCSRRSIAQEADLDKTFTSEDLLVAAWKRDRFAFGLRGYEQEFPDNDKVRKELDSRGAPTRERFYRFSLVGLTAARS